MQRGDKEIPNVEDIIKYYPKVRYPTLFNFIQCLIFPLNPIDQGTIARVYKQLQRPFTTENILIADTMII